MEELDITRFVIVTFVIFVFEKVPFVINKLEDDKFVLCILDAVKLTVSNNSYDIDIVYIYI
jgi:hypothetical protein